MKLTKEQKKNILLVCKAVNGTDKLAGSIYAMISMYNMGVVIYENGKFKLAKVILKNQIRKGM